MSLFNTLSGLLSGWTSTLKLKFYMSEKEKRAHSEVCIFVLQFGGDRKHKKNIKSFFVKPSYLKLPSSKLGPLTQYSDLILCSWKMKNIDTYFFYEVFRTNSQARERRINLPVMKLTHRKNLKSISCLKAEQHWWCTHIFSLFPLPACYQWTHIMHITHKSLLYLN
jgi:hypothetical protein